MRAACVDLSTALALRTSAAGAGAAKRKPAVALDQPSRSAADL